MINERTFPLSTGTLAALELGQQQSAGTSVIFIHGWLDNAGSFKAIMETMHQLAPDLHLLAIDLFGHGLSSHKAADNYYAFHDYVDDLHRLLSDISSNHVVLVGHSLGALIASCYSATYSGKAALLRVAIVLLSQSTFRLWFKSKVQRRYRKTQAIV